MLCEGNSIYFQIYGDIALVITIGEGGWLENLVAGEKYFAYPPTTVKINMYLTSQNFVTMTTGGTELARAPINYCSCSTVPELKIWLLKF